MSSDFVLQKTLARANFPRQKDADKSVRYIALNLENLERVKGFEPSTPTLARLCSTTELHPRRTEVLNYLHL